MSAVTSLNDALPKTGETNDGPIELSSDNSSVASERVELFRINGKGYSILATPRPNLGLKYLWSLRNKESTELAMANLLVDLIGEDGFQALMNYDALKKEQFDEIVEAARDISMGGMEEALGNS